MAERDPWIKFYPDDWNNDLNLAACSLQTQGVYIRLIAVLHRGYPYGYLPINPSKDPDKPFKGVSLSALSRVLNVHHKTLLAALQELLRNNVLRHDETGIFSKRMVLDKEKREEARKHGARGGNPRLTDKGVNPSLNPTLNPRVNPTLNPEPEEEKDKEEEGERSARAREANAYAINFCKYLESLTAIWPVPSSKYGTPENDADMAELGACLELLGSDEACRLAEEAYSNSPPDNRPKWAWQFKRILQDEIARRRGGNGKAGKTARGSMRAPESDIDRRTRDEALGALGLRQ